MFFSYIFIYLYMYQTSSQWLNHIFLCYFFFFCNILESFHDETDKEYWKSFSFSFYFVMATTKKNETLCWKDRYFSIPSNHWEKLCFIRLYVRHLENIYKCIIAMIAKRYSNIYFFCLIFIFARTKKKKRKADSRTENKCTVKNR